MIPEIDTLIAGVMEELAPVKIKYEKTKDGDLLPSISFLEKKLAVYRLVGRDLMEARTNQKRKISGELTEDEIKAVWQSEVKKRKKAIDEYAKYPQTDKIVAEIADIKQEIGFLESNMPDDWKEADDTVVGAYAEELVEAFVKANGSITMKNMGTIMADVKKRYPTANGKVVSDIVKAHSA